MIDLNIKDCFEAQNEFPPIDRAISAIIRKNSRFTRNSSGGCEKVWYPEDSAVLCWINIEKIGFETHWHPSVEIIMPFDNEYYVNLTHESFVLKEGDIMIIPPGELHELLAPPSGMRLIIVFDYTVISSIKGFSGLWGPLSNPTLITAENAPEIYEKAKNILLSILNEYIENAPLWEISVYSLLMRFFILANKKYMDSSILFPEAAPLKQNKYIEKFHSIFDYIDKNYMNDLTLEELADAAGFSKFHFSRIFKQVTNSSFPEYLNKRRIRAAETMLLDTSLPITDIAMMCGFSSISTFNRVFKSVKHYTPTDFKKLYNSQSTPQSSNTA